MKKLIAVILAAACLLGVMPMMTFASGSANVTVSVYEGSKVDAKGKVIEDSASVLMYRTSFTVEDGEAEKYGFTMPAADHNGKAISQPVVLDAVVTASKAYFSDFSKENAADYIVVDWGYLKEAFGVDFTFGGFIVNDEQPNDGIIITSDWGSFPTGYNVETARIKDGDEIELYVLADRKGYSDAASWIEEDGAETKNQNSLTLTLKGYDSAMMNGNKTADERAELAKAYEGVNVYEIAGGRETLIGKTDASGKITVDVSGKSGAKQYVAYGTAADGTSVLPAYADVKVSNSFFFRALNAIKGLFAKIKAFFAGLFK